MTFWRHLIEHEDGPVLWIENAIAFSDREDNFPNGLQSPWIFIFHLENSSDLTILSQSNPMKTPKPRSYSSVNFLFYLKNLNRKYTRIT